MDHLTFLVVTAHAQMRLDYIKRNPHLLVTDMVPKLKGVLQSFDMLKHNLEADANKLTRRIQSAETRREKVFSDSHGQLDKVHGAMNEIDEFISALEGSNNGPPLDDSSESSPDHLTVNGALKE